MTDRETESGAAAQDALVRLADRLRAERPQARAVVLSLLEAQDAARVLQELPRGMQAETVACMILQGHVERDVLKLVEREFLRHVAPCGEREKDPVARTLLVLDELPGRQKKRLFEELRQISKRAWQRLDDAGQGL